VKQYDSHPLLKLLRDGDEETLATLGVVGGTGAVDVERIRASAPDPERRHQLLEALRPRWQRLQLSQGAREAIERLQDPHTRIVIGGQQPALWGGPLLGISKALGVCMLASRLEAAGIPTVPLFWIADDDHDGEELDPGSFASGHDPGNPHRTGRDPIFMRTHSQSPRERLDTLSRAIGDAPYRQEAVDLASGSIASTAAEEYLSLLCKLLGDQPLLPVLPRWFRKLQVPLIQQVLASTGEYRDAIQRAIDEQVALDVPAPVPAPRGMPLFIIDSDGLRRRPEEVGMSVEEVAEYDFDRISPDALLRTVVQDQLIDPVAVVLGATEMCYAIETRHLRQDNDWSRPQWLARPRLRPISSDLVQQWSDEGLDPCGRVATADPIELVPSPQAQQQAQEISRSGAQLLQRVEAVATDEQATEALRRRARRLVRKWSDQLARLETAVEGGLLHGVEARRQRVSSLLEKIFPGGDEPERSRNLLDLIAHQGPDVIERMRKHLEGEASPWDGGIIEVERSQEVNRENHEFQR